VTAVTAASPASVVPCHGDFGTVLPGTQMGYGTEARNEADYLSKSGIFAHARKPADWWMTVAIWASFGLALICVAVLLLS
jgi:hypothetical protein